MPLLSSKFCHWLAGFVFGATAAAAQDSKALIDALVRKGVLTNDEATAIVAEAGSPRMPPPPVMTSGGPNLRKLTLSGRFQVQYAGLDTYVEGASGQPAATDHFFLRRIHVGVKADLAGHWAGTLNYDFAGSTFDAAFVSWQPHDWLVLDVGLRKVPFLLDEFSSSVDIRAIERSPLTRYFVESNNGRRLGAGSYRVGAFVGGTLPLGFFYNLALTNPERDETFSGVVSAGNRANNRQAFWANAGVANQVGALKYRLGALGGYLPDQGGRAVGVGDNLAVYGAYVELQSGGLFLRGEYALGQNEHGASAARDAHPSGYYVMPCYRLGNLEAVVRYSHVNSDGRGLDLSDGIRSAPSSGTLDRMSEWFVGGNYYFQGNETKLQLGYVHGEAEDALTGAPLKATTDGVRSQLQVNF